MACPSKGELAGICLLLQQTNGYRERTKSTAEKSCVLERAEWEGVGRLLQMPQWQPGTVSFQRGRAGKKPEVAKEKGQLGKRVRMLWHHQSMWEKDQEKLEGEGDNPTGGGDTGEDKFRR